jgi:hypothetical protein
MIIFIIVFYICGAIATSQLLTFEYAETISHKLLVIIAIILWPLTAVCALFS